jgi:hypothetical protein
MYTNVHAKRFNLRLQILIVKLGSKATLTESFAVNGGIVKLVLIIV